MNVNEYVGRGKPNKTLMNLCYKDRKLTMIQLVVIQTQLYNSQHIESNKYLNNVQLDCFPQILELLVQNSQVNNGYLDEQQSSVKKLCVFYVNNITK